MQTLGWIQEDALVVRGLGRRLRCCCVGVGGLQVLVRHRRRHLLLVAVPLPVLGVQEGGGVFLFFLLGLHEELWLLLLLELQRRPLHLHHLVLL